MTSAIVTAFLFTGFAAPAGHAHEALPEVVVYKTARCECCNGWIEHMRKAGW